MNTIADTPRSQAASFQPTASAKNAEARFVTRSLHKIWQRRRLKARLLHPVRKVLRPLALWLRQEHFDVGEVGQPVPLQLRRAGWPSALLSLVLAPLVFIMLLPLLILIFPAVVVVGLAAVGAAALQTEEDDVVPHSMTWHAWN